MEPLTYDQASPFLWESTTVSGREKGKTQGKREEGPPPPREVRLGTFVTPILILPSPQASLFRAAFVFWVTWSEQAVRLGFVAEIHWTERA